MGAKWNNLKYWAAIDPAALVLPPNIYVKWVEGRHPHTPEQFEIFLHSLLPAEVEVICRRATELRDLSGDFLRVTSKVSKRKS